MIACNFLLSIEIIKDGNLTALVWVIEHDMNLELLSATLGGNMNTEGIGVIFIETLESLYTLRVLCQTFEAEVLEADDRTALQSCEVHGVVPYVVVVLHVVVGIRTVHIACYAGRVVAVARQTENLEALAGNLGTSIFVAVRSFCRPLIILCKRIISYNAYLTAIGNRLLVPLNLYRSHHSLTGIAETTWWTMIEYIPLTINLLNGTVSVVSSIGGDEV